MMMVMVKHSYWLDPLRLVPIYFRSCMSIPLRRKTPYLCWRQFCRYAQKQQNGHWINIPFYFYYCLAGHVLAHGAGWSSVEPHRSRLRSERTLQCVCTGRCSTKLEENGRARLAGWSTTDRKEGRTHDTLPFCSRTEGSEKHREKSGYFIFSPFLMGLR